MEGVGCFPTADGVLVVDDGCGGCHTFLGEALGDCCVGWVCGFSAALMAALTEVDGFTSSGVVGGLLGDAGAWTALTAALTEVDGFTSSGVLEGLLGDAGAWTALTAALTEVDGFTSAAFTGDFVTVVGGAAGF